MAENIIMISPRVDWNRLDEIVEEQRRYYSRDVPIDKQKEVFPPIPLIDWLASMCGQDNDDPQFIKAFETCCITQEQFDADPDDCMCRVFAAMEDSDDIGCAD